MSFNIKIPLVVASHIVRRAGTAICTNKAKAAGFVVDTSDSNNLKFNKGGTVVRVLDDVTGVLSNRTVKVATLALNGTTIHAGAVGMVNPEAVDVIALGAFVQVSTHATAASGAIDVGWTSSSISTASDTIADGLAVGSGVTVPIAYCANNQAGANGKFVAYWTAATWITVSDDGTASVAGMVGTLYVAYILV